MNVLATTGLSDKAPARYSSFPQAPTIGADISVLW